MTALQIIGFGLMVFPLIVVGWIIGELLYRGFARGLQEDPWPVLFISVPFIGLVLYWLGSP